MAMMRGGWVSIAAVNGLFAVALGAFAAHGLAGRLQEAQLTTFEVGVRYQMYHALALLAVAWVMSARPSSLAASAGVCMLGGIALFSGSLYGLALLDWKWLGPITPIGGVLLMVGWLLLALAGWRMPPSPSTSH